MVMNHKQCHSVAPSFLAFCGMMIAALFASAIIAAPVGESDGVSMSNAWVRAMPPTQRMTAAYFEITNHTDELISIAGVSSSAGNASLHETKLIDNRSTMRPVPLLAVPPGETVQLQPGGLHVMLMGMQETPSLGEQVTICVAIEGRSETCIEALVRRRAGSESAHQRRTQHKH